MTESGLQESVKFIYSANAVVHMMTGKAFLQVVRAHLVDVSMIVSGELDATLSLPSAA